MFPYPFFQEIRGHVRCPVYILLGGILPVISKKYNHCVYFHISGRPYTSIVFFFEILEVASRQNIRLSDTVVDYSQLQLMFWNSLPNYCESLAIFKSELRALISS